MRFRLLRSADDPGPGARRGARAGRIGIGITVVPVNHLGIPGQFQALVIGAIETGQIPQNTSAYDGNGKVVQEVTAAAYAAFHDGLHLALSLAEGLVLAAGLLALIPLRSRPAPAEIVNFLVIPSDRGSGQPQGPVGRK